MECAERTSLGRQVNQEITNKLEDTGVAHNTFVEADTTCTKPSDTAYECIPTFTSPPGTPTN